MSFLAIDSEANGLYAYHGCKPFAFSICHSEDGANEFWDFAVNPMTREVQFDLKKIKQLYNRIKEYTEFTFHNCVFDLTMLKALPKYGRMIFEHILSHTFHDTMFSAHIVNSKDLKGLKEQAMMFCDILDTDEKLLDDAVKKIRLAVRSLKWAIASPDTPELAGQKDRFHKCDMWIAKEFAKYLDKHPKHPLYIHRNEYRDLCETYNNLDTWRSVCLRVVHKQWFEDNPQYVKPYEENIRTVYSVLAMQDAGVPINRKHYLPEYKKAKAVRDKSVREMQRIVENTFGTKDFNYNSNKQLPHLLFNQFMLTSVKLTKAGNNSTDKHVLPELRAQVKNPKSKFSKAAKLFLDQLFLAKEVQAAVTYMESYKRYQIDWVLHPSFNIVGTSTVRISSSNPNGQNIGKGKEEEDEHGNKIIKYSIRKIFGPESDRVWLATDYDQLQLRIFAYWSKEDKLIEAFKKGFDFHTYMAMLIFETDTPTKLERRVAKSVNFGYIFGAGEYKIDSTAGTPGLFRRVQKLFPNVTESINRTVSFVKRHGYVETASGYKLTVDKNKAYAGVNYIVQGTEGDIVKKALNDCYDFLSRKSGHERTDCLNNSPVKIVLQVHDEIIFSIPKVLRLKEYVKPINTIMEKAGKFYGVECKCKPELIHDNWSEPEDASKYLAT